MSEEGGRGTVMFDYSHSVLHFIFALLFIVVGNVGLQ